VAWAQRIRATASCGSRGDPMPHTCTMPWFVREVRGCVRLLESRGLVFGLSRIAALTWHVWPQLAFALSRPVLEWSAGPLLSKRAPDLAVNTQLRWLLGRLAGLPRKRKGQLAELALRQALRRAEDRLNERRSRFVERSRSRLRWLVVATTDACNLRCTGCYAKPVWAHRHVAFARLEYLASEAERMGAEAFVVTGWGEPFFDRRDKANLSRLVRAHPGLMFAVFTNGTLITEEDLDAMKSLGNLILLLSLDGLEATNDARRGKQVFRRVEQTARQLNRRGVIFGISTTVTSAKYKEVTSVEFTDAVREWGAFWVLYLRFSAYPIHGEGAWLALDNEQVLAYYRLLAAARESQPMPLIDADKSEALLGGCQAQQGSLAFVDAVSGRVAPCVKLPFAPPSHNLFDDTSPGRLAELLQGEWSRNFWKEFPACWMCSSGCGSPRTPETPLNAIRRQP